MLKQTDASRLAAAAAALVRRQLPDAADNSREALVTAITNLLIEHVHTERDRAVRICRKRSELWRTTTNASGPPPAREEARARANEASYLADLLEAGEELPQFVM